MRANLPKILQSVGYRCLWLFIETPSSGREVTPIARQNYEKAYFRGNIIACRYSTIYDTNSLTGDLVKFHIIPQERAIDIDNEIDFKICENLIDLIEG